jgi:hypothetical protein
MFATKKFRDVFSFPVVGGAIPPQLYATGSRNGSGQAVAALGSATGNVAGFKKWLFIAQTGSGGATTAFNFWVSGGSVSGGNSMLPATSTLTYSGANSFSAAGTGSLVFGSNMSVVIEVRQEYLLGLGSNVLWIQPVMSITGASAYASMLALAFLSGSEPASLYDATGAVFAELDAY